MDITTTYTDNYECITKHCKHYLQSDQDAEDVAQEAFLRLIRHVNGGGEALREPRAWLTTVSTRLAIDRLRKRRTWPEEWEDTMEDAVDCISVVERVVDSAAISPALAAAIASLSPAQRQVFLLRYADGCSVKEVAAMTGRTEIAVRVMAARAKKRLAADAALSRR